tara:strand:+ start:804 stop:2108 length:1305 start_codon:yes stop_codon:yes gene_type:complete
MFKLNSKTFYLRHNKEIDRFLNDDSEWLDITSVNNPYIENNQNILRIDLDKEVADQFKSYPKNSFDLIVLTNIFELTPNIYEFLLSIQKILKEDGRILITSVNPRWNLLLLIFEKLNIKTKSKERSYVHPKKIYNIAESSGLELNSSFSRQFLPFNIFGLGHFVNKFIEAFLFKFNLGINNYMLFNIKKPVEKNFTKTIIVPAKNEEKNLEPLIRRVPKFENNAEIIIICGESKDKTYEKGVELKNRYKDLDIKVLNQKTTGKGPAVIEAIENSSGDLIGILDADLSVDPETLVDFFEIVEKGRADFINGTRLIYKMESGAMRKLNNIGNIFFQFIISILISKKLTDSLCGTKVFKRSLIHNMYKWKRLLTIKDPFGDFDLIFSAAYSGEKILEYPVHYKARTYGSTQISRFKDGFKLIFYFFNSLMVFNTSKK